MKKATEIFEKLCSYDTRNPNGVAYYLTKEEIKEEGYTETAKRDCYCDNCFYGKTELAEYILKLKSDINKAFDQGFNISNERFNAEIRDEVWDSEDYKDYEKLKNETIEKHNLK